MDPFTIFHFDLRDKASSSQAGYRGYQFFRAWFLICLVGWGAYVWINWAELRIPNCGCPVEVCPKVKERCTPSKS